MDHTNSDTADFANLTYLVTARGAAESVVFDQAHNRERASWLYRIRKKLADLSILQANWDSYGAQPIGSDTIGFGFQVLTEIWSSGLSDPDISPMSNEGIMFEWIANGCEYVIEIEGPHKITYYFSEEDNDAPTEGPLSQDLTPLISFSKRFVEHTQTYQQIA